MEETLNLVRDNIREKLNSHEIYRRVLISILKSETIVEEERIIYQNKKDYNSQGIKIALKNLVDEGILNTGFESGSRWYFFRRECQNHYTAEIRPNKKFRAHLQRFIDIYKKEE